MRNQNIFFISVVVFLIILIFFLVLLIGVFLNIPISEKRMERLFVSDYSDLSNVADCLIENGITEIYLSLNNDIDIEEIKSDDKIMEMINNLKTKGYKIIVKNNEIITFLRWSTLDAGRGFVYSINGNIPELQFLTNLKKLSKSNWYYYEEDFNKWELQN